MKASDIIKNIRQRIFDVEAIEYEDSEIILYLNDAILLVGYQLVANGDEEVLKDLTISTSTIPKPSDFQKWAGKFPATVSSETITVYGETLPLKVRYFKKPTLISNVDDTLPFINDTYNLIVEQVTAMIALSRNEYNVDQEKGITEQIQKLISMSN